MGDFDIGSTLGRFFWSAIDNPYFCGVSFRIGIDNTEDEEVKRVFAISIQIAYLMISVGWVIEYQ